jgi:hypothetical protein
MTAENKANELIDKFIPFTKDWDELNGWMDNVNNAKQCDLIAVDEIIKEHYPQDAKRCEYWNQVKQEIEKL